MLTINAIKCPECECMIYSRTPDDYRVCPCKSIAIQGTEASFKDKPPTQHQLTINATPEELFNDCRFETDGYGIVYHIEFNKDKSKKEDKMLPMVYNG